MLSNPGGLACSGSGHALGESDAVFGPINTGFKDGSFMRVLVLLLAAAVGDA